MLEYSNVSRRWNMLARYYAKVIEKNKYPDAGKQEQKNLLAWLEKVLAESKEDCVIVIGHHPIYAESTCAVSERIEMQQTLDKVLRAHSNVAGYI